MIYVSWFLNVKPISYSCDKPSLIMRFFFYIAGFSCFIFEQFLLLCSLWILNYNFLFLQCVCLILVSGLHKIQDKVGSVSSLFSKTIVYLSYFILKYFMKFTSEILDLEF